MKKETLQKANDLANRIKAIEDRSVSYTSRGSNTCSSKPLEPHEIGEATYSAHLNEADSDALFKVNIKFLNALKQRLQKEFDSLK